MYTWDPFALFLLLSLPQNVDARAYFDLICYPALREERDGGKELSSYCYSELTYFSKYLNRMATHVIFSISLVCCHTCYHLKNLEKKNFYLETISHFPNHFSRRNSFIVLPSYLLCVGVLCLNSFLK